MNTPPRFKVVGSVPAGGLSITLTVGDVTCALFTTQTMETLSQRRPELAYKLLALVGASIFRNFRINIKRLAINASMAISEKEQFEGELQAAQHRAKVALGINPDAIPDHLSAR